MVLLYYIILSILEPFIFFSILYDCMTCDCNICDHPVMGIMHKSCSMTCVTITHDIIWHFLPKSKIKKSKSENQNKQSVAQVQVDYQNKKQYIVANCYIPFDICTLSTLLE